MSENKKTNEKKTYKKDTQARSYCICFHDIEETGFNHDRIKKILHDIPSLRYYCIADEIGCETKRLHTHLFFALLNPLRFSTLCNKFAGAKMHAETCLGTAVENMNYVFKIGEKWENDPKADQRLPDTQESFGELPKTKSHQGKRSDLVELYDYIVEGKTNAEILAINPDYMRYINHIDRTRQAIREAEFKDKWRDISCIYVFGETNTNKTRTYMEKYGYEHVYRITNYNDNAIWDGYRGQDVVIFEEYRSQVYISDLLVWTEGYPNCSLRARYSDKVAMYTKVVYISNISLEEQYPDVQIESPATWRAFLRRIQKVIHHKSKTEIITYNSVDEYLHRNEKFRPVNKPTPFDNVTQEKIKDIP